MTPLEFITFKKTDFEDNCIKGNKFSEPQSTEFFEIICTYIERFRKVRYSESLTIEIRDELVRKSENHVWIDNNWESNKYSFITGWITKAVWQDRSYYWAKVYLGMHHNRKSNMATYKLTEEYISDAELFDLLKAEEYKEPTPQRFIIKNDDEMKGIYTICQGAFDCDYSTFRAAIETANFQKLNIKRLNITQELVYRLSDKMGVDWYTKVCEINKWKKSDCSKHGDKVKDDILIKQLERILPRQIKRYRTK